MKKLRQSQNLPRNKARMKLKKARVIDLCVKQGKTIRQASRILKAEGFERGVSRSRVGVALQEISRDIAATVPAEREKAYNRLQGFLDELEKAKQSGKLDLRASISDSLQVMDRLSRLLGLDAPTKSISAKVNADIDPESLRGYRKFVHVTCNMDQITLDKVYAFAAKLNTPPERQLIGPPATSELWEQS